MNVARESFFPPPEQVAGALGGATTRLAYHAGHAALVATCLGLHARHGIARPPVVTHGLREAVEEGRRRYRALLDADLAAADEGLYSRRLLVPPLARYAARLPGLLAQGPAIRRRRDAARWREVPADAAHDAYPAYFRRTFHWQTDGYLSARSARLYDVGVELLFLGTADVMRRAVLPAAVSALRRHGPGARVVDVGCGTGRTLAMLHAAAPDARLVGVDLSPWYVQAAREELARVVDVSLVAAPAEALPFPDGWSPVVTSTWMFHELPRAVRRHAAAELVRITAPGGTIVLMDAAQRRDAPALVPALEQFPRDFHEPYFLDYLDDPLDDLLEAAGAQVVRRGEAYVSRVVVARRP